MAELLQTTHRAIHTSGRKAEITPTAKGFLWRITERPEGGLAESLPQAKAQVRKAVTEAGQWTWEEVREDGQVWVEEDSGFTTQVNGSRIHVWYEQGELADESAWLWSVTDEKGQQETGEAETRIEAESAALLAATPAESSAALPMPTFPCKKCGTEAEDGMDLCRRCWNAEMLS